MIEEEWLILGFVGLLLWGGHWMPWRLVPFLVDEKKELHRPLAYIYGCLCILAGVALWGTLQETPLVSVWITMQFLVRTMAAAGLSTMAPRIVKWVLESQAARADKADYEQAIKARRTKA